MTDEENKINETTGSAAEAETAEPDLSYKTKVRFLRAACSDFL